MIILLSGLEIVLRYMRSEELFELDSLHFVDLFEPVQFDRVHQFGFMVALP